MRWILTFSYTPEEREALIGLLQARDFGGPVQPMPADHLYKLHEQAATSLLLLVPLRVSPPQGSALTMVTVTGWDREILRHRVGKESPAVELVDPATGRCWAALATDDAGEGAMVIYGAKEGELGGEFAVGIAEESGEDVPPAWGEDDGPNPVPPDEN